jgi:hypothetical protein
MRVLVCGDRYWCSYAKIESRLKKLPKGTVIIEGECRGADLIAKSAAKELGFEVEEYPADWDKYGKAAGYRRNSQMLTEGKPDLVIAFHQNLKRSKGTKMMLEIAQKAGVPTELIEG